LTPHPFGPSLLSRKSKIVDKLGSCTTQRTQNTRFTSLELHSYCTQVMTHTRSPKPTTKGQEPHLVNADHLERVRGTTGGVGRRRHLQRRQTKHQSTISRIHHRRGGISSNIYPHETVNKIRGGRRQAERRVVPETRRRTRRIGRGGCGGEGRGGGKRRRRRRCDGAGGCAGH
jgi:hypothetical protein